MGASSGFLYANSACNVGVAWTAAIRYDSASNVVIIPGAACANSLVLDRSASTVAANINFRTIGAENFIMGMGVYGAGTHLQIGSGASAFMAIGTDGKVYIQDTINDKMTVGLTINQKAADDEILALKSSDVAHGITDLTETDTYGLFNKAVGGTGGLGIHGATEGTIALFLDGAITTADTTKATSSEAPLMVRGVLKSGTSIASLGVNANIMVFRDLSTTRFILDADGDSHQDVGTAWTNFDDQDDIALLDLLAAQVTRLDDPVRATFGKWLCEKRDILEHLKIVTFNEDGHHFLNTSKLAMLQVGAIRQMARRIEDIEAALAIILGDNYGYGIGAG